MADPTPTSVEIPTIPARWGFSKGLLTGAAIEIPAIAATVWLLARVGVGDPDVPFMHVMRLTALFAGIAALLTAGGIGRLAAYASMEGGRRQAILVSARAHAVASAGLVLIATIPHGDLPLHPLGFLPIPLAGLVTGAACGALIGAVCGGPSPVGFTEVLSVVKRPGEALRHLLSPDDIVRLGHAVRDRATHVFEGMFDPAAKRPAEKDKDQAPPKAPAPPKDKD